MMALGEEIERLIELRSTNVSFQGPHPPNLFYGIDDMAFLNRKDLSDSEVILADAVMVKPFNPVHVLQQFKACYGSPKLFRSSFEIGVGGKRARTMHNFLGRVTEAGKKN